jgi:hypothetical protein
VFQCLQHTIDLPNEPWRVLDQGHCKGNLAVKARIEPKLPSRGGKTRDLTKEDFSRQSAIFLRPKAQFDLLAALPDSDERPRRHRGDGVHRGGLQHLAACCPRADTRNWTTRSLASSCAPSTQTS